MAETLNKVVVNCETGESQVIPLTADEIKEKETLAIKFAEDKAKLEAEAQAKAELKASAKAKLIAGEPLTEEEAATIVL